MRKFISHRLRLLEGSRGDAAGSIKELVVNAPIRAALIAAAIAATIVVVTLNSILSNSATASVRLNVGDIEFKQDVRASTLVHGYGSDRVALLSTTGGNCSVKQWYTTTSNGVTTLRSTAATVSGECSPSSPIDPSPTQSELRVDQLQSAPIVYENLGGRTITFDATGNPTLSSGSRPANVTDADWNDLRPYLIRIDVKSADEDLAKFSRQGVFTGTTAIVNAPAAGEIRFVPPTSPIPTPSDLRITSIVRSQTLGATYSGAREGVSVTFTGGVCDAMPTNLNLTYTTSSPAGVPPVNVVTARTLTGAASTIDLAGVPNGSSGTVTLTAACGTGSATSTASANYHQDVPPSLLTVKQGANDWTHSLSWTAVSSLPTTFQLGLASTKVPSVGGAVIATTTALTYDVQWTQGWTYGADANYYLTALVNNDGAASTPAVITTPWPTTPAGANMTYTRTGYNGNYASGNVKWNFTGTCPAGTTLQASQLENHAGTTSKTYNNAVQYQGPFTNNLTQVNWGPSYAMQGYPYGMGLQTRCASPNGLYSPIVQVQSKEWITPMAQPGAPVWNAYNIYTYTAPIYWTHSTCNAPSGCSSLAVNYITYCAAGSNLNSNGWMSTDWGGGQYWHNFGFGDYWQLPNAVARNVTYTNAQYNCATPWGYVSPMSPIGAGVTVTVFP
ncbi:hypothetical protein [Leifsonia sp. TF02-11]|uniref:hypothetical protein n=1 Tax=Leifsonia sp. TF02-11 TaxID=2815212 RepID=UPI001AA1CF0A|nr:hypothetical protein [Leifsonia sp. TF02-11]MBO1741038.1 hypothetical protein [Leifsonia sp. TF02-11]